jgi:hypothetical protein
MFPTTFQLFSLALAFFSFARGRFHFNTVENKRTHGKYLDAMAIPAPLPAVTTLAVPQFVGGQIDPVGRSSALPAVVLGIDSQGRTTYAVEQDGKIGTTTFPSTGEPTSFHPHASPLSPESQPRWSRAPITRATTSQPPPVASRSTWVWTATSRGEGLIARSRAPTRKWRLSRSRR